MLSRNILTPGSIWAVQRDAGIKSCLISHPLLWLCHSVHQYLSLCPLRHCWEPLIIHTAPIFIWNSFTMCQCYWDSLQGETRLQPLSYPIYSTLSSWNYFPQSNMTFLLIILQQLPLVFLLKSDVLIPCLKVLDLWVHCYLPLLHSCSYDQLFQDRLCTNLQAPTPLSHIFGYSSFFELAITLSSVFLFQSSVLGSISSCCFSPKRLVIC